MATAPDADPSPAIGDDVPKGGVFSDYDDRQDDLQQAMDGTVRSILAQAEADVAAAAGEIEEFLQFMADCHDYSARNTWLLYTQARARGWHRAADPHSMPTMVGGASFWREYDRYPAKGEKALYVWRPILDDICPDCGYGAGYDKVDHEAECDADPANADEDPDAGGWEYGVVTFVPAPVFDVSQTDGADLPAIDTADISGPVDEGDVAVIWTALDAVGIDCRMVPPAEWDDGHAAISEYGYYDPRADRVTVKATDDPTLLARTLILEAAHALCHDTADACRVPTGIKEVEAEGAAYVVGTHLGLEMDGAAQFIARWCADIDGGDIEADGEANEDTEDDPRVREFRALFGTIGDTATTIIDAIETIQGTTRNERGA